MAAHTVGLDVAKLVEQAREFVGHRVDIPDDVKPAHWTIIAG
jgi:hypothetical protein